jgi:hypothetical protein
MAGGGPYERRGLRAGREPGHLRRHPLPRPLRLAPLPLLPDVPEGAAEGAILEFGTLVESHVRAARHAFRATFRRDLARPEIWSTQWQLAAASNNLNWEGVDLRSLIAPLAANAGAGGEDAALEEVAAR